MSISQYVNSFPVAAGEAGFNEAFELCASSLEYLRIQMEDPRGPRWDSHFGPARRLTCLPSMPLLREIEIPVAFLCPSVDDMRQHEILDLVPTGLESIYLTEDMGSDWFVPHLDGSIDCRAQDFKNLLGGCFIQLWTAGGGRFPALQNISLEVKDKPRPSDTRESNNRDSNPDEHFVYESDVVEEPDSDEEFDVAEEFAEEPDLDEQGEGGFSILYNKLTGFESIGALPQVLSQAFSGYLEDDFDGGYD